MELILQDELLTAKRVGALLQELPTKMAASRLRSRERPKSQVANPKSKIRSFMSQRLHWVESGRTPRGQPTGEHSRNQQEQKGADKGNGIGGRHLIEKALH